VCVRVGVGVGVCGCVCAAADLPAQTGNVWFVTFHRVTFGAIVLDTYSPLGSAMLGLPHTCSPVIVPTLLHCPRYRICSADHVNWQRSLRRARA